MKAINTQELTPENLLKFGASERLYIYNGLDCCVTSKVFEGLMEGVDNATLATYDFSKSLQGPILEINLRGILVDEEKRQEMVGYLRRKIGKLEGQLDRIIAEGIGEVGLNWRSPAQLKRLFYEIMGLPPVKKRNAKGLIVETVDRDALEKLSGYFYAELLINHLLLMRDIAKKISVLETDIDSDGRFRNSTNIAGTTTGRLSSSYSETGSGGNLQNIEEMLRQIFISDPGMKFAYVDLEQAESRAVGAIIWNLFGDGVYLDATESGDLHTYVSRLTNPSLPWTGNLKKDKEVAERPFYRQHSFRHMNKVLGHGSNYLGQPYTMAKHTKIPATTIKEFQVKYFGTFPGILKWHERVADVLRVEGKLTTIMGRKRYFWGRRTDPTTIREAVAFEPQSMVADILNRGMLQVWRLNICQLLLQIHDAILIQYPEDQEDIVLPKVLKAIEVSVELNGGRKLLIPSEAKVGWNWAPWSEENPNGLAKYRGAGLDARKRTAAKKVDIVDRDIHSIY